MVGLRVGDDEKEYSGLVSEPVSRAISHIHCEELMSTVDGRR